MKKVLICLTALLSFAAAADNIETPAFKLKLGSDWKSEQTTDPEQQSSYSRKLDVGITASYMLIDARGDTERIANKLRDFRLAGEEAAGEHYNVTMTIAEPIVLPFSKGHQVAYFGHDSANRQFRYLGLVMSTKTVSLYAESGTKSQQELSDIFDQLIQGLSY